MSEWMNEWITEKEEREDAGNLIDVVRGGVDTATCLLRQCKEIHRVHGGPLAHHSAREVNLSVNERIKAEETYQEIGKEREEQTQQLLISRQFAGSGDSLLLLLNLLWRRRLRGVEGVEEKNANDSKSSDKSKHIGGRGKEEAESPSNDRPDTRRDGD